MRTTRIRTVAAFAATLAATAAGPALAQTPRPTLSLDRSCYTTGDHMTLRGSGYTPSGPVRISVTGRGLGVLDADANSLGQLRSRIEFNDADIDTLLAPEERTRRVAVSVTDEDRWAAAEPESRVSVRTTLARLAVSLSQADDAIRPGRRLNLDVIGFTGMAGKPLYLHYVRGGTPVATVRLGRVTGACGRLKTTLRRAFPSGVARAGRWTLVLGTTPTLAHPDAGRTLPVPIEIPR